MVLESKGDKTFEMILQLFKSLSASSVITVDQLARVRRRLKRHAGDFAAACSHFVSVPQGYERVYMDIADINIDVPRAYFILEQFVDKSFGLGIINVKLRDYCPSRYDRIFKRRPHPPGSHFL